MTHTSSHVEVLLNTSSEIVKSFNTLHYEGSQSRVDQFIEYLNHRDGITYTDPDYHNIGPTKKGWYVENIHTDMQDGTFKEFIEKEGKWFNYIKGSEIPVSHDGTIAAELNNQTHDSSEFSWQGIGRATDVRDTALGGCMNTNAINFDCATLLHPAPWPTNCNDGVSWDDGSCILNYGVEGCDDPNAINFDCATALHPNSPIPCVPSDNVTYNDGSCVVTGCTDPTMFNYNPLFNGYFGTVVDDGSCIPVIYGCTQPTYYNYAPSANSDCGITTQNPLYGCLPPSCFGPGNNECCVANVYGCTDPTAFNYNPLANVDDGSCTPVITGCMNPYMTNYDPLANVACNSCCTFNCPQWSGLSVIGSTSGGRLGFIVQPYSSGSGIPIGAVYVVEVTYPGMAPSQAWDLNNGQPTPQLQTPTPHYVPFQLTSLPGTFTAKITFSWPGGETNGEICEFSSVITIGTFGCNDVTATNYNPAAQANDGTCIYCAAPGCQDGDGSLNPMHGVSGLDCTAISTIGNTTGEANNHDPSAQCDDPYDPCQYHGCRTPSGANYSACYNRDCSGNDLQPGNSGYDDSCCAYVGCTTIMPGCYPISVDINNPPPLGQGWCLDGTLVAAYQPLCGPGNGYGVPYYSPMYNTSIHPITGTVAGCGNEISGCIDSNAGNFNPCATTGCGACGAVGTCCTGC
jgi:hypothetical protein